MPFIQKHKDFSFFLARDKRDERYLMDNYVMGKPEKINSRLASESTLKSHILASIAGTFTKKRWN
jgi:replicative superfamily II helicase